MVRISILLLLLNNLFPLTMLVNGSKSLLNNYLSSMQVTLLVSVRKLVLTVRILGVFSVFINLKRLNNSFCLHLKTLGSYSTK